MLTTEEIKEASKSNISILKQLLPCAVKKGNELVAGNVNGDKGDSFSYNISSGVWADFASGEKGRGVIDLIISQEACSTKQAFDKVREMLGDNPFIPEKKEIKKMKKELSECPAGIYPQFAYIENKTHRFSKVWAYVGQDGKTYGYDCRVDFSDGKKAVIPMVWDNNEHRYKQGMLPEPRLLCGEQELSTCKKFFIVEGCKTRDAVKHYFPTWGVLTWQGGCNAVSKANWGAVKDKEIIIIPDADRQLNPDGTPFLWKNQHGQKAALEIAKILSENNHVRLVNTEKKGLIKSGWDFADAEEEGLTQKDLIAFIKENLYEYLTKEEKKEDVNIVVEKKDKQDKTPYDDSYFRCLGEKGSSTFFFKYASGQVIEFTPSKYEQKHLVSLAPLSYWEALFPAKTGVDWLQACDFFSRIQEKIGYFNAMNVRGRGCWFDNEHIVLHLGKSLIVDGNPVALRQFKTENIYENREAINVDINHPMPKEYSKKLIELCSLARWEESFYGEILAGWLFSAMVCGAMKFRSHLYLIGQSGSGKSWLQDHIIKPILGKMCVKVSSKTSEAGIRAMLNNDILPVVCDENEVENSKKDREALDAIFDLARNASSEYSEPITKSSPTGQVKVYYCRSAFLFSSIKTSMEKVADLNRTAFVRLKNKPANESSSIEKSVDNAKFEKLRTEVEKLIDHEYCESLLARAVRLAAVMRQSQQTVSDVSAKIFGNRRQGDQMGMIIAGIHGLKSDLPITEQEAEDYLNVYTKNKERVFSEEDEKQEMSCVDTLLRMPIKIQMHTYPLARILSFLLGLEELPESKNEVVKTIAFCGIKIVDDCLCLSTKTASEVCEYFRTNTMYGTKGWIDEMSRVSKKVCFKTTRFTSITTSRGLCIPLDDILNKKDD